MRRSRRSNQAEPEKGIFRNLVIPAVGIAILIPAVYTAFYPNPGAPLKWVPYIILGWTVLGGAYLVVRDRGGHAIDLDYAFADLGEAPPDAVGASFGSPARAEA